MAYVVYKAYDEHASQLAAFIPFIPAGIHANDKLVLPVRREESRSLISGKRTEKFTVPRTMYWILARETAVYLL